VGPPNIKGSGVGAGQNELAVDNFLLVFFFNDFNAQMPKSVESNVLIDF
jgi:hypothetical protein